MQRDRQGGFGPLHRGFPRPHRAAFYIGSPRNDWYNAAVEAAGPFKLSVVVPVYNERLTLPEILERVQAIAIPKEIVIVDDGSTHGTRDFLRPPAAALAAAPPRAARAATTTTP